MKGSPEGAQGRAKKMKQAGPPETKKQRCVLPPCFAVALALQRECCVLPLPADGCT